MIERKRNTRLFPPPSDSRRRARYGSSPWRRSRASCAAGVRRPRPRSIRPRPKGRRGWSSNRRLGATFRRAAGNLEHGGLARRKMHGRAADEHLSPFRVERDVAEGQRVAEQIAGPAQQRLQARDQLLHRERLCEIVVGAAPQAGNTVADAVARGQYQHRRRVAAPAHSAQHVEPIFVRQAEVEDERCILHGRKNVKRVADRPTESAEKPLWPRPLIRRDTSSGLSSTRSTLIGVQPPLRFPMLHHTTARYRRAHLCVSG